MPNPQQLPSTVNVALLKNYEVTRYIARGSYGMVFAGSYTPPPPTQAPAATNDATPTPTTKVPVAIKMIKDFLCGLDPAQLGIVSRKVGNNHHDNPLQLESSSSVSDGRKFSERYRSIYIKRIVRELQILRYFKGCFEFIELIDAYFSPDGRDLYLVMPFVSFSARSLLSATAKSQLRSYMKACGGVLPSSLTSIPAMGLPEDVVRVIMVQLLSGLQKMEKSNCGHRDLTANNILIESDSLYTYLCDFGLSRAHMAAEDNMTLEVVTQPYRAPELLFQCARYDQAIDIWSAGIVMFELLTGSVPVLEKDVPRQLLSVLELVSAGGKPDLAYWKLKGAKESALRYIALKTSSPLTNTTTTPPATTTTTDVIGVIGDKSSSGTTSKVATTDLTSDDTLARNPYGMIRSALQIQRTGKHLLGFEDGVKLASHFSQEHLSDAGIEVLESLLHEKPEMRKNYDELLNMRWFRENVDCVEQLSVMKTQQPSGLASVSYSPSSKPQAAASSSSSSSSPPSSPNEIPNIEKMSLGEQVHYMCAKLVMARADHVVAVQIESK